MKSQFFILLFVFCCLLFVVSCRERIVPPEVPPYVSPIVLTAEDIGVTDTFIKIKFVDTTVSRAFTLTRDGQTILAAQCSSLDTLILDEGLLPKCTYKYKAYKLLNNIAVDSSAPLIISTLDSSSHNFSWQIDTLGDGNSSVLRDVFILNDTLAYAVGEIYKKDSLGNWDPNAYNLSKWNGQEWTLMRVPFIGPCSAVDYPPIRAIWVVSANHILLTNGGAIVIYDGINATLDCRMNSLLTGAINKIFATSSQDIYAVGNNGMIVHYTSGTWRRLESGTTTSLLDVWGTPDGSIVWACGWEDFKPTVLLKITNNEVEKAYEDLDNRFIIRKDSLSGSLGSCWTNNNKYIYVLSPSGLYKAKSSTKGEANRYSFTSSWFPGFPWRVRGNLCNDIFISGEYYMLAHFNGSTFKYYNEFYGYGRLMSIDHKSNLVVSVGYSFDPIHSKGIVVRGRR